MALTKAKYNTAIKSYKRFIDITQLLFALNYTFIILTVRSRVIHDAKVAENDN